MLAFYLSDLSTSYIFFDSGVRIIPYRQDWERGLQGRTERSLEFEEWRLTGQRSLVISS